MLQSQNQKKNDRFATRTSLRVLSVLALLSIGALAVASVSVSSRGSWLGAKFSSIDTSTKVERANPRRATPRARSLTAGAAIGHGLAPMFLAITVDRTDDLFSASACTAAANDCSLRGAVAFANANPGTTINVPAGTYSLNIPGGAVEGFNGDDSIGDLDFTASGASIVGAGAGTTIIRQTQPNDRVIELNPFLNAGFTFSISDVTVTGGRETTGVGGGGMLSGSLNNIVTVTNCVFSGNSATGAGTFGGGGISHAGGTLSISGSSFTGNSTSASGGGIGYSAGDPAGSSGSTGVLTVTTSSFTNNNAASIAGGGGAADLFDFNLSTGIYNISSSSFAGNTTSGSGGAIIVESGGPLTVNTSSFSANHANNRGGAIFAGGTTATVTFSRLVGNTVPVPANGLTIYGGGGTITANDNWWGINTGPGINDAIFLAAPLPVFTWLQLEHFASPNTICTGGTTTLTADIKQRNLGPNLTVELNGLPAFPVPPAPIFVNAVLGTISGASTQLVNGSANATFTAGATPGTGSADALVDNQVATASIIIQNTDATTPADQAVCQGVTANFSTTASGTGPFHYAWTVDGSPFDGDNPSISVPTGSLSPGNHPVTVTVSGACGSAVKSATLTVQESTTTTTPADQTVCQGATATFSTTASGSGPFHYAWTVDGSPFGGDTASISVPTGALTTGSHPVSVTVTGACGSDTKSATLTVQENTAATTPADQTVCQGATAGFSTTASGTGPFHYAWTVDGSAFGGDTASISVPTGAISVGSHPVSVTVSGACGSTTKAATLTVQENTGATTPADQSVCQGATAAFSTTASGTGPFHYAWTVDGSAFGGDTASISVPTGALTVGAHPVSVTVSGTCGSVSKDATLTVQENTSATTPADQTVCLGATAAFSTTASGTGPFHYAWTVDGSPFGGDTASISVATGALSVGTHPVSVTVSGTCGTVTENATLTVQPTTTTTDPADQTVCQGATAGFSTTAGGTGPFHYAWTVDGSPFGGDTASISVSTGSLSVGNHTVSVTTSGACGSASQTAILTVQENTSATGPVDQTVCPGATATFSTTASGTGPFHYAWTVDGSAFGGDTASISVPTGALSIGAHPVSVTVSGTCGSVVKNATLTIQEDVSTTTPADQTVCAGVAANFSTTASGTGPFHYAWTVDGSPFGGDTASISVPTGSLSVGAHPVTVTTTGTCGSVTRNATLTIQPSTTTTDPADQNVCQGAVAGFSTTAGGTGPFHYSWTVDGSPFGGDSASISVATGSLSVGNHTVSVTTSGACGNASQSATLTVRQNTATSDPPDRTACVGSTTVFSTTATGSGPFTFVWKKGATVLHTGDLGGRVTIANGSSASSLTITNVQVSDAGAYTVETSGSCNMAAQSSTLAIDNTPPAISCQADIIVDFNPAVNGAVVTYTAPVGTDSCAGATTSQIAGLPSGSTFPLGTTTNTFRVTDTTGQTAQCSFKVTVAETSIIGLNSVSISGASFIDSYDSLIGYPASKSSLANVLSNGTITLAGSGKVWGNVRSTQAGINMSGGSSITGNATAGTTVVHPPGTTVGGTITNNAPAPAITLPTVPACGPPYSSNSGISGTYSYSSGTGNLTLTNINVATLAPGNYCFHNVSLANAAQLKVNGLVTMRITGTLNVADASTVTNMTSMPGNLRVLSSYTGSNGVIFGNGTSVYLVVYAPKTDVSISGSVPLFGTVAAKTINLGNSGAIHYDTRLKAIWPAIWAVLGL